MATYENNKVWIQTDSKDDNPHRVQDILEAGLIGNVQITTKCGFKPVQTNSKQIEIPQQVQFRQSRGMGCTFSAHHALPEKDSMHVQDSVKCT